jgi:hypothetical protein
MKSYRFAFWPVCFVLTLSAHAAELEAIPSELAQQLAPQLVEQANKIERPKFKIDADTQGANGFHVPRKLGGLIVPQKGLKEGEELAAKSKMDPGASLAYLFAYNVVPVVDGKRIDPNRFNSVMITDGEGQTHTVHVMLLSVRQLADDDYRLYVFGTDPNPLVDVKFAEGTGPGPTPVAVELKDPNDAARQGTIAVTVFGKYQAKFTAAYTGE